MRQGNEQHGREGVVSVGLAAIALVVFLQGSAWAAPVRVAVAANVRGVMERLAQDFEADTGTRVEVISGSTGKLYAQIRAGAPFDVFLAADQARPVLLQEAGYVAPGRRLTYAIGRLVLWDPEGGDVGPHRLRDNPGRRVALANPALAPYGAAAQAVLRQLNLEQPLGSRLVFGENVAQAFTFVRSRNAALGFVALSQLRSLPAEELGSYWEPPLGDGSAIRQDMVLLQRSAERPEVQAFFTFMVSESTRAVLQEAGYKALAVEVGEDLGDDH